MNTTNIIIGNRVNIIFSDNSKDFEPKPIAPRRQRQACRLSSTQRAKNTGHDYLTIPNDTAAVVEDAMAELEDAMEELEDAMAEIKDAESSESESSSSDSTSSSDSSSDSESSSSSDSEEEEQVQNIAGALAVVVPNDNKDIKVFERVNNRNAPAALGHLPPDNLQASTSAAGCINEYDLPSPAPAKKRKRYETGTPKSHGAAGDEEDDGLTCSICLGSWEVSGEHRLVSLSCGHLFGDACIRRWLNENAGQSGIKGCPQCKTKATNGDIRCLYAKRLRAIDRSEELRLREQFDKEQQRSTCLQTELDTTKMSYTLVTNKIQTLEVDNDHMRQRSTCLQAELDTTKMSYTLVTNKIQTLEADNNRMKQLLRGGNAGGDYSCKADFSDDPKALAGLETYGLSLEHNIEVCREPGCRVLLHDQLHSTLLASQKSVMGLSPGYGVRLIDVPSFRTSNFMHTSNKLIHDMCLSSDQQLLAVSSMETRTKLFDLRTHQMAAVISLDAEQLWSCAMDRNDRCNLLYLGASDGSTYVYDVRFPKASVAEFKTKGDLSPVINLASVGTFKNFPNGGIIVCKQQSLWFHEYSTASGSVSSTRFNIEGPFTSMHFDDETVLLSTRNNARYPRSRYIIGKLDKIDKRPIVRVRSTLYGSKTTPVMTRSRQIAVERNTLIAGYVQDTKQLTLYDVRRERSMIATRVQDVVYDTCPLYLPNTTYLAALTETQCRIYKLYKLY